LLVLLLLLLKIEFVKPSIHAGFSLIFGGTYPTKIRFQTMSGTLKTRSGYSYSGFFVVSHTTCDHGIFYGTYQKGEIP
jgi:hypothetical protein